ncbi:MAG: hydrogenase maturation protease [Spirochaetes bacterium]|nr:hydrogenase maturation protease [Spirochaetota bacterium]
MMLFNDIRKIFKEGAFIVGMGNPLRGDDGAGSFVAKKLITMHPEKSALVVDVEDVIEAYAFSLAKRKEKNAIIIDSVNAPLEAGTLVLGKYRDIAATSLQFSTHKMSASLVVDILENNGKCAYLLGIVSHSVEFGEAMSESVERACNAIVAFFSNLFNEYQKEYAYER